jgi:hypothetical protein
MARSCQVRDYDTTTYLSPWIAHSRLHLHLYVFFFDLVFLVSVSLRSSPPASFGPLTPSIQPRPRLCILSTLKSQAQARRTITSTKTITRELDNAPRSYESDHLPRIHFVHHRSLALDIRQDFQLDPDVQFEFDGEQCRYRRVLWKHDGVVELVRCVRVGSGRRFSCGGQQGRLEELAGCGLE